MCFCPARRPRPARRGAALRSAITVAVARRPRLPNVRGLRDLPEAIRRRRSGDAAPSGTEAQPATPPPPTPVAAPTPPQPPPTEQPAASPPEPPALTDPPPATPASAAPTQPIPAVQPAHPGEPEPPDSGGRLRKAALVSLGLLLAAGLGVGAGYLLFEDSDPELPPPPAPTIVLEEQPEDPGAEAAALGFPAFATLNTTRIGGVDSAAVAAGTALAAYPSEGVIGRPRVVTLVPSDSWQAGVAASSLSSPAVGAPILLSGPDEVPPLTTAALELLEPTGFKRADNAEVIAVGEATAPGGLETLAIKGSNPAALAAAIDEQRAKLTGVEEADHILVVSSREPDYAIPAAAWAARSGDPVVFADGEEVPEETIEVLERHPAAPVYVLGPEDVIANKALRDLGAAVGDPKGKDDPSERKVVRIEGEDPISNAIEFARFFDGTFGWNINDPGHGLVIVNTSRPEDAAAVAPLSAAGKPGPLLLTDSAEEIPKELRSFLLDTKPGYLEDPTRAVYNHVWVVGDASAISIPFQAEVDRITALAKVSEGSGLPELEAPPEDEPPPDKR